MDTAQNITSRPSPWVPAHWAIRGERKGRCPETPHKELFEKKFLMDPQKLEKECEVDRDGVSRG